MRQELHALIDTVPEVALSALQPLLSMLSELDKTELSADLTEEEHRLLTLCREDYRNNPQSFVPLEAIR
ncbi:MAG: hypothetical protein LBT89_09115 [Planctomycetaceae bacterium]|jgi:hypothetical protein|nr:hypothetical protein [Planctomycetaceae bacterium]